MEANQAIIRTLDRNSAAKNIVGRTLRQKPGNMSKNYFSPQKSTKAEIIAQLWFFSCDAPDTDETAHEIQRLAKMIYAVMAGETVPWRIVNHSLRPTKRARRRVAGGGKSKIGKRAATRG